MKLYISYYGNYVSIVEGKYNKKKDKHIIKKCISLSSEEVEIDDNDKYSLLRKALSKEKWNSKDVILCLNTKDIIIKSNSIHKVNPKDLDGIMENEMDELMSLDYEQYIFSYEVTNEIVTDENESLDVVIAAIRNEEIDNIIEVFKDFKLNLQRVDTISTAYNRLLKKIEYDNIMILNIGNYGSIVDIFKEDSLFIHDNIPIRVNEKSSYSVCIELAEEIKGLMNFYSSRNFGNMIDTIVLVGQSNGNTEITNYFKTNFPGNVVNGIDNLFDIEEDIIGDIKSTSISSICEILGAMSINYDIKKYKPINLLPVKYKNKKKKSDNIKKYIKLAPIALIIMLVPYIVFATINLSINNKIEDAEGKLNEILDKYKSIENIDKEIEGAQQELEIYNMLSSKRVKWGDILTIIDSNIPYHADLTNVNVYYNYQEEDSTSKTNDDSNEDLNEVVQIYDQIPNLIELEGQSINTTYVGQFVYNLNKIPYFKSVELKAIGEDKEKSIYNFNIVLTLKEGVISGE